jgi:hypothetical protein
MIFFFNPHNPLAAAGCRTASLRGTHFFSKWAILTPEGNRRGRQAMFFQGSSKFSSATLFVI